MRDDQLIERIRAGDEQSADELVRKYYTSILRYCRYHCNSMEKAEDLTQETFLKLFQYINQYENRNQFKSYLYTIANHVCIDESRKREVDFLEGEVVQECKEIQQIEDRDEVWKLLKKLSDKQREAIILRYGEGLSFKEIARILHCTMRTAQSRVASALNIMRKEEKNER